MIEQFLSSQTLWIVVTLGAFLLVAWIQGKVKSDILRPFINPLLLAIVIIIILLLIIDAPYSVYNAGGRYISLFVTPATVALAIKLEKNFEYLRRYWAAIITGIVSGTVIHTIIVFIFGFIFNYDAEMVATLYPKSITTAIAVGVSESIGGIVSLTVALVVFTGVIGSVIGEVVLNAAKIKDPVAQGVGLGMSSHAMGTSKAIQMGDVQGAMAGVSIVITGIVTVLLAPVIEPLIYSLFG